MATIKTQPVVGDSGSQEMAQLVRSYNNLLDVVGDLITGLKTVVDEAATNTLAATAETALQTNVFKILEQPPIALGRKMNTY
jgi:anti-sigma regulatory factor (Ser/Thr protein kinase)